MTNQLDLPSDAEVAKKVLDARSRERGMLGHIFGTREHAPTNIAALALILLLILFAIVLIAPLANGIDRSAVITTLLSAITFIIGIIFGRKVD